MCRVANATPEKVCEYVRILPKEPMSSEAFRTLMERTQGKAWFQNIHQAPEQWGLYCLTEDGYIPRFRRDITLDEAAAYLKIWIRNYPLINPYTTFKHTCDLPMVDSIVEYLKEHPQEKDFKAIIRNLIGYDGPFVVNEIIVNAINNYSGKLITKVIDKATQQFEVYLSEEKTEDNINMDKSAFFHLFDYKEPIPPVIENVPLQQIFFGAPGTGKSHEIKEECQVHEHYRVTFHPDTDYASFVGAYKPTMKEVTLRDMSGHPIKEDGEEVREERISYEFVQQAFLKAYVAAWRQRKNENPAPVFLVIEEINRGNCAQIFGDLFQLLDRNEDGFSEYPVHPDSDISKVLAKEFKGLEVADAANIDKMYAGRGVVSQIMAGSSLVLPNNLYIWATMNTSDQSLFPIDSAFKRRWDWKYIKIADGGKDYRIKVNGNEYDWWEFVQAINSHIGTNTSQEDKKLGYFFVKAMEEDGKKVITADRFLSKVLFYLYGDVYKDYGTTDAIFQDGNGMPMEFSDYFDESGKCVESKVECFITNLKLRPLGETAGAEDMDGGEVVKAGISARVNGIKVGTITYALYNILRAVAGSMSYSQIVEALKTHIHRDREIIKTIPSAEGYQKENGWYNYKPLASKDGKTFVITNQWKKEFIPQIKALAESLDVEFEDLPQ